MPRLLIIEDDDAVAEALQLALTQLGHTVRTAPSAEPGLAMLDDGTPTDLAIVDVMLPGMDGFELCRRVSATRPLPLVLLTARSDPIDIVVGLECGADDYVAKPVEPRVLDARIKAVLRRSATEPTRTLTQLGDLTVDEAAMRVHRDGEPVLLTPTELRLLLELLHHAGQARSRRVLLERVWEYGFVGDTRLVDACVQRLRAKVEPNPSKPTLIQTVRGVGYRLELP
ncbi:response regulator transcription factor [Nocardioides anomalus]|uniref:Response regulator transcription factor n=1 Tax=Nocardioides anomalus TaxID=2712223 RepID=A0A6G6WBU3_9ACTN|nr:response regulator transcription factor [Nocardioides anomalus]QIG42510.1 response regulator transcription factor [Nocardioides anomalus]